ncbi:MAG: S-layer homology domain-containing protein [Clostridia bacterium]|nr:S-layer homology domain-containing protein [Clostridia bacterium]
MIKRGFSALLSIIVCLTLCSNVFAANKFSDVTQQDYPWAVNEIEEMAGKGIIKGYSDSIFGPADEITKIQALLLCSRILGFADNNNTGFIDAAYEAYTDVLDKYDTPYKKEVAYLIYKGVLNPKELTAYIGEDNADIPLKRYEAATLMTKVMDAEDKIEDFLGKSVFTDASEIPAAAKPYVNYVNSIGLMLGMNKTNEVNEFAPNVNVTRAQMAVLLYRMMSIMNMTYSFGTAESVDTKTKTIMFTDEDGTTTGVSILANTDVKISVDGYSSTLDKIKPQSRLLVIKKDGVLYAVEAVTVIADEDIVGVINSKSSSSTSGNTIKIRDIDSDEVVEYKVSKDVSVTFDGAPSMFTALKTGYLATLSIKGGEVISIAAVARETTAVGTVSDIVLSPELKLIITNSNGETEEYTYASGATAVKNGSETDVRSIMVGDKVTLSLVYNRISKVNATSSKYDVTGTIDSILIATMPKITVVEGGNAKTVNISRDAVYSIDGKEDSTIYDLRLGATITLSVQGETAVKITSTAPTTSSVLTGTIDTINTSYGFLVLNITDPVTQEVSQIQVFLKKTGLKILDSTNNNKEVQQNALKAGMNVSVTGKMNTGAFETSAVIILP